MLIINLRCISVWSFLLVCDKFLLMRNQSVDVIFKNLPVCSIGMKQPLQLLDQERAPQISDKHKVKLDRGS